MHVVRVNRAEKVPQQVKKCCILQWNACCLIANGQEFKRYLEDFIDKPDLFCVQESWLKLFLDFVVPDYVSERLDGADKVGGGLKNMQYRSVSLNTQLECMAVRV